MSKIDTIMEKDISTKEKMHEIYCAMYLWKIDYDDLINSDSYNQISEYVMNMNLSDVLNCNCK